MFFNHLQDKNELLKLNCFPERIRYAIDKVTAAFPNISCDVIETMYQIISSNTRMAFEYNPKDKLKKNVYLIKASQGLNIVSQLTELYDLDKVSMLPFPLFFKLSFYISYQYLLYFTNDMDPNVKSKYILKAIILIEYRFT